MQYDHFDTMFAVSTYKSTDYALKFLQSTSFLSGYNLVIMVSPEMDDLDKILKGMNSVMGSNCSVILMHSRINSHVMGRSWPFVWAVNNNLDADFVCVCDDDIEFAPAGSKILRSLHSTWSTIPYSMMTFNSTHPMKYPIYDKKIGNLKIGLQWLDGNCIFSRWNDNLRYGVMDALPESRVSFFVETEYCHRFRYLAGKPLVIDDGDLFYYHHFREDSTKLRERRPFFNQAVKDGENFWRVKFGLNIKFERNIHDILYNMETAPSVCANFRKHMLFNGEWTNWSKIYENYNEYFSIVGSYL